MNVKAIPYGLGLRIKRICNKEEDYQHHRMQLKGQLKKQVTVVDLSRNSLSEAMI